MGVQGLGTFDIVLLVLSLMASAVIGVYHGVKGLNQTSTDYLLGGRMLKPLPLAMSLTVGTVSAITIMGNAGEMYAHGTQMWMMDVGLALGMYFVAQYFIPIFYPMKMVSLYHYIEARFQSVWLRRSTVILTLGGAYLFIGFLLFPPSLFLVTFTGLSITWNIIVTGLACSIYSSFGGVKAVVYTDVLQSLIMIAGSLAIVLQGSANVGGLDKVWDIAYHHQRIELFNISLDPLQRHSFWLVIINGFFFSLSTYGVNQSQTQRTFSTSSVKDAKRVMYYAIIGMLILKGLTNLSGIVMFANYVDCDPLTRGGGPPRPNIGIVIQYVLEYLTKIPGLAGLFVASIYAAVLSSVSTQVNSMTALLWEDFLKALPVFQNWSDQKVTRLQKVLVMITGVIGIFTSLLASTMGSFLKDLLQITGAVWGPMVGLFLVALYFPWVKARGAGLGFLVAITISIWIVVGQIVTQPKAIFLPMSHESCPVLNNKTAMFNESSVQQEPIQNRGVGFYGVSYCLNYCWGVLTCILVALIFTAFTASNTMSDVDEKLIHRKAWSWFSRGIKQSAKDCIKHRLRPWRAQHATTNTTSEIEKGVPKNEAELQPMKKATT